jgi:hypothetical protein
MALTRKWGQRIGLISVAVPLLQVCLLRRFVLCELKSTRVYCTQCTFQFIRIILIKQCKPLPNTLTVKMAREYIYVDRIPGTRDDFISTIDVLAGNATCQK